MKIDDTLIKEISEASLNSSDPERSERNLIRFFEQNTQDGPAELHVTTAAKLFAASQFLANYCILHPEEFYSAMKERDKELGRKLLQARVNKELLFSKDADTESAMKALREFKKRYLLRITLRDISGETDIQSSMDELSYLAEVVICAALEASLQIMLSKYGEPENSVIALIALGKLGGEELNYSSDVDIVAVYSNDDGQTSGVKNPAGIMFNKISNHEFYCKVVELFSKLLSSQTEDGVAYRVDLRLRPQGQKGDITLPINAYKTYYESWGRTWERMVLIRARPIAGDNELGKAFMETIRPFVWRETLDYSEIEEIRGMKKSIDSTFSREDIKRGYGGIREAEFFVQTFQLLFVGKNRALRTYRILNAIQALKWMKIIPEEDLTTLWENYLYLRRVEQYLQMKEDLQTHTLPASEHDMLAITRLMNFHSQDDFLADLQVKRMQIKSMYNSLLGTQEDVHDETLNLLEGGLKDYELTGYLSFRKVKDPKQCINNFKKIRDHMRIFHTMQERTTARRVVPLLIESALSSENPDRAIAGVERLLTSFGDKPAYLTALTEQKELLTGAVKIFALSSYLPGIFLSSPYYLNMLIEEWSISRPFEAIDEKLKNIVNFNKNIGSRLARFRRLEEIRLGMLFLQGILTAEDLFRDMSYIAESMIHTITKMYINKGLSVIALGKLGGREMTFGSDLDIIFISKTPEAASAAEKIMKTLTAYTDMGLLYSVDTRLRPDGSKGILVKDIEGYKNYYLNNAQNWEIQALLKARPAGGDEQLGFDFLHMAREVIIHKGGAIHRDEITAMRERIKKELTHEADGIDIKLGTGGIEEIEFFIQYLQLHHAADSKDILTANTPAAISRLAEKGILNESESNSLSEAYNYFRKVETFLRLNEEKYLAERSDTATMLTKFMKAKGENEFIVHLKVLSDQVMDIVNQH
jgi:glutamate-ammonia-ligase adenylyltransferase